MADRESRYSQALAYAWGRFDNDEREYGDVSYYGFSSDQFAQYYADEWEKGNSMTLYQAFRTLSESHPGLAPHPSKPTVTT